MPRAIHRRKRGPINNVQTKLATRLMQISLRMDDHIYYNKPISRDAAEEFLQEVKALKLRCPRKDVRSLQVIDKISVLLKKIIAGTREQVTNLSPTIQAYAGFSQSHSPVYSLPDEDRTESDTLYSDVPIIDITEQSSDSNIEEQNNAIENVNFAISNMSIQDENLSVFSVDACSQSILDSYYNVNVVCNDGHNLATLHMTDAPITPASNELSNHTENATLCTIMPNQGEVPTEMGIDNIKQNIIDFGKEITVPNFPIDQKVTLEEKKHTAQRKKMKDTKKATKNKKPNSANFNSDGVTETSSKPTKINKNKKTKKKDHSTKEVPRLSRGPGVNGEIKIYNRNVENDLSWVENLRYVREIGPEENDPALCNLGDNFWDHFSLPNQWNDLDFYA